MEHVIKTDRLYLQAINESDIEFMQELTARPESFKYDSALSSKEMAEQCRWYMERMKALPDVGAITWIVRKDNVMIGEVHLECYYEKTHEWEIGYRFLKEHWGNGFASEAVKAVIQYAFEHFNVNRIVAYLNAENDRSAALCERIGMVKEGRLREFRLINGIYYDDYLYSLLKREYHMK